MNSRQKHFTALMPLCFLMLSGELLAIDDTSFKGDLLAEETLEFEFEESLEKSHSWLDETSTTLLHTHVQGRRTEIKRSELRLEYEVAPWEGAYLRFDNKYSIFEHGDALARMSNTSYGHNKLQQAWLQLTSSHCVATLGRQGLFWGVVEGTFAVDVITPFDFTEQLLTDYSNVRLSQDMLVTDCFFDFYGQTQLQWFYLSNARLDSFRHRNNQALEDLENELHDEWGVRVSKSWQGFDVSLMYARLHGNTPVVLIDPLSPSGVSLDVPKHDFFGLSAVWALGRLLMKVDLAYKQGQLEAFSGQVKSEVEGALGVEYTTSGNHHFNAGVWFLDEAITQAGASSDLAQVWVAGWNKLYLNDDLTMSFLGSWVTEPEQVLLTFQALYQWDDYWSFSSALTYSDLNESTQNSLQANSEVTMTGVVKVQF